MLLSTIGILDDKMLLIVEQLTIRRVHSLSTSQITKIIKAYSGTKFIMIGNELNMPGEWLSCFNTKCLTFRDFVTYCDV